MGEALKLSWSALQSFMECQRRYQLNYIEGVVKPTDGSMGAMVLGSHVHAGWERALRYVYEHPGCSIATLVEESHYGVRDYRIRNLNNAKVKFDYETQQYVPDAEYFAMMETAFEDARRVLSYQIPRFDWDRYQPVTLRDVFSGSAIISPETVLGYSRSLKTPDDLLLEWKFELPFNDVIVVGIVDAVLFDKQQYEYVILDWKTRGRWVEDALISLDGQMPLYAAIINQTYGETLIHRCVMYQVSSDVPGPAKLTPAKKQLSTAPPGSTWEVWAASVYALGLNPEHYRAEMEPKMRKPEDYTKIVNVAINGDVDNATLVNLGEVAKAIRVSRDTENFPGILSHRSCQFCDYRKICSAFQGGGDANLVIQREYVIKRDVLEAELGIDTNTTK